MAAAPAEPENQRCVGREPLHRNDARRAKRSAMLMAPEAHALRFPGRPRIEDATRWSSIRITDVLALATGTRPSRDDDVPLAEAGGLMVLRGTARTSENATEFST